MNADEKELQRIVTNNLLLLGIRLDGQPDTAPPHGWRPPPPPEEEPPNRGFRRIGAYDSSLDFFKKRGSITTCDGQTTIGEFSEGAKKSSSSNFDSNAFTGWSNIWAKGVKLNMEAPKTRAPKGFVPKVRKLEEIFADDQKYANQYEEITKQEGQLTIDGLKGMQMVRNWEAANFCEPLMNNIERSCYVKPRLIQSVAIPLILDRYDVVAMTETGSGKTAAFLLPIIQNCVECKNYGRFVSEPYTPYAVIIGPTRELMHQIYEQALKYAEGTDVTVGKAYGQYAVNANSRELYCGCDILMATPGRLDHFVRENIIHLQKMKILCFDEGDLMISTDFADEIEPIMNMVPPRKCRQTLFFSATFSDMMLRTATRYMRHEESAFVSDKNYATNQLCHQKFMCVTMDERFDRLVEIFKKHLSDAGGDPKKLPRTLVFVNTQVMCDELAEKMKSETLPYAHIRGDYAQDKRMHAFDGFRSNKIPILITTDVCSRGIDIKDIDLVLNYEIPLQAESYIYRIGRVGRIQAGNCLSFIDPLTDRYTVPIITKILEFVSNEVCPVLLDIHEEIKEKEEKGLYFDDPAEGFDTYYGERYKSVDGKARDYFV